MPASAVRPLIYIDLNIVRELSDLALVAALGIDLIDDEYAISVQVIDPSQNLCK